MSFLTLCHIFISQKASFYKYLLSCIFLFLGEVQIYNFLYLLSIFIWHSIVRFYFFSFAFCFKPDTLEVLEHLPSSERDVSDMTSLNIMFSQNFPVVITDISLRDVKLMPTRFLTSFSIFAATLPLLRKHRNRAVEELAWP